MSKIQQLNERRGEIAREVRRFADSIPTGQWDEKAQEKYDQHMTEIENLEKQISVEQKMLERFAENQDRQLKTDLDKTPEYKVFQKIIKHGVSSLNFDELKIYNTMSTTTGSEGGFTVPSLIFPRVIDKLKDYSAMRQVSEIVPTASGEAMPFAVSDGTSEVGEILAENATGSDSDPSFSSVAWAAYMYSSKVITVPWQLLDDSIANMEDFILNRLAARIGRITNNHYTTGTGSSQPLGIAAATSAGRTGATGQTTTIIYDDLIELMESVDVAYLSGGVGKFMMGQTMRATVRKIKDSQNMPIFMPGFQMQNGLAVDTLLGAELVVNNSMATPAASAKTVLFGDLGKYVIRDVIGSLKMLRYDDSAYAKKGQRGFQGWFRTGGTLSDTAAVKHYAHSAS